MGDGMSGFGGLFANPNWPNGVPDYGPDNPANEGSKVPLYAIGEPRAEHVLVGTVLRVKADHPVMVPMKAYDDDAGLDMHVSERVVIRPGEFKDVPSGISVQLPEGTWGMIQGRSSTLRKRSLLVNPGVIDVGYRGPLFSGCWNLGRETVVLEEGERVAQLILIANVTEMVRVVEVDELDDHPRGSNGFGSSGQ